MGVVKMLHPQAWWRNSTSKAQLTPMLTTVNG